MKIAPAEILKAAQYDAARDGIRARVLDEKRKRRIHLGPLTFLFENRETLRYQIQEMVRAERLHREEEIQHEIHTYGELLGGPGELGCTLLIELTDPRDRDAKLRAWLALPSHLYLKLADGRRVQARFDPRQVGADRLSSVQYLKFATGPEAPVAVGCDLPGLEGEQPLAPEQREALQADLRAAQGQG